MAALYTLTTCPNCNIEFNIGRNAKKRFCTRSCAAKFNNVRRRLSPESRAKISDSLKKYAQEHRVGMSRGIKHAKAVGARTKGKYKKVPITTLFGVNNRTRSKLVKRLGLTTCCICGWADAATDIHHIILRKDGGTHDLDNLTVLCPNHHRMAHEGKVHGSDMVRLSDVITVDMLNDVYYG